MNNATEMTMTRDDIITRSRLITHIREHVHPQPNVVFDADNDEIIHIVTHDARVYTFTMTSDDEYYAFVSERNANDVIRIPLMPDPID